MTISPGASLDNAISGINRRVDNAKKVAAEINKDAAASAKSSGSSSPTGKATNSSRIGGNVDVKA